MNNTRTIREILQLSPEERKNIYQVNKTLDKNIDIVKIDNDVFTDFKAFSFIKEKTYLKSPTRASDGSIPDLDTYGWFLTPHLKIDFSLMSIDSYRRIMQMIRSKNEFVVTCYDIVEDKDVTHKMYFATEQMPKLWSIARALNGESWVELLGVQDYTVELIGTNTEVEEVTIKYYVNAPSDVTWNNDTLVEQTTPSNITAKVGASVATGIDSNGNPTYTKISELTFGNKYKFKYWSHNSQDGVGFKYAENNEYLFTDTTYMYAIWEASANK